MRISSFNVNGIRAAGRRGFHGWLAATDPDVVALQEVRCPLEALPEYSRQRVESTIPADSREHAQSIIQELLVTAKQNCPVQVPGNADNQSTQTPLPSYCQEIMQ